MLIMAAAALPTSSLIANPENPNSPRRGYKSPFTFSRLSLASRHPKLGVLWAPRLNFGRGGLPSRDRRIPRGFAVFASDESTHPDIEMKKEKDELRAEDIKAEEAWKETLESVKVEALKMKEISHEAYEVYSKKAMVILKETSERLKIQAHKAKEDLNILVKQISKEGKFYLSTAAEKSPDSVKDVVETFAFSTDELKEMSAVRDFHLGIPYGAFLSIGGFLSFMLTGSISAIRFGVILGSALFALSVASLRSWKNGQSSELLLKGQAAIAAIIFLREWRFFCQRRLFSTLLMTLISGAMLAFYVYRMWVDGSSRVPPTSDGSEN